MNRRLTAFAALAALLAAPTTQAATRPAYGGDIVAYVFGAAVSLSPRAPAHVADRAARAALFEPLYRRRATGLVPVLASGPPVWQGNQLFVPLRRGVQLHDGRRLTPALVKAALLATLDGAGGHVLTPVRGAFVARTRGGSVAIEVDEAEHGLRFELLVAYPEYVNLLASAHAQIAVPSARAGRAVGTGPFELEGRSARGAVRLRPFLPHRGGRPFLDALEVRVLASRSGAVGFARRGEPRVLFGVPDARAPKRLRGWPEAAPRELVVLRAGDPALAPIIDGALQRPRLVRRFMDEAARPTRRLRAGLPDPRGAEQTSPRPSKALTLLVSQTDRAGWQFAKRVQLDLLRAGISATLERVSPETCAARLVTPGRDLVLGTLLPDAREAEAPIEGLHGLLSIAAHLGAPDAVRPEQLVAFLEAPSSERLGELEARLRAQLSLVPIATRPPGVMVQSPARGLEIDLDGALRFEDAWLPRAAE